LIALRGPYRFKGTSRTLAHSDVVSPHGLSGVYEAAVIEVRAVLDCDAPDVGFRVAEAEAVPPARPFGSESKAAMSSNFRKERAAHSVVGEDGDL
jgi:hypothetical protein